MACWETPAAGTQRRTWQNRCWIPLRTMLLAAICSAQMWYRWSSGEGRDGARPRSTRACWQGRVEGEASAVQAAHTEPPALKWCMRGTFKQEREVLAEEE